MSALAAIFLAQNFVEIVLELQLLLLQRLDGVVGCGSDARFHVLDLLVELVVAMEELCKMRILGLEARNLFAELGKHEGSPGE